MRRLASLTMASLFLWILVGTHGLAVEQPQGTSTLGALNEGIRLIDDGAYEAAIDVLEAAVLELDAAQAVSSDMARSYFYVGVARVFVVGDDEARFAFLEAQQHDPQFRPSSTDFPRRVIRLWEEAGNMDREAESPAGGETAGTLTVVTEPAGATVYVAGRPRGETPVEVAGLAARDHRVTIVKDGYINNSRVLTLAPNSAKRLSVELTAAAAGGSAAALQEDSPDDALSACYVPAQATRGSGCRSWRLACRS